VKVLEGGDDVYFVNLGSNCTFFLAQGEARWRRCAIAMSGIGG
jgi:hypothetical protein